MEGEGERERDRDWEVEGEGERERYRDREKEQGAIDDGREKGEWLTKWNCQTVDGIDGKEKKEKREVVVEGAIGKGDWPISLTLQD